MTEEAFVPPALGRLGGTCVRLFVSANCTAVRNGIRGVFDTLQKALNFSHAYSEYIFMVHQYTSRLEKHMVCCRNRASSCCKYMILL